MAKALDSYSYPVDLAGFPGAPAPGNWFQLNIAPGDPLQTTGFETRFREQARHHIEAWAEVVFWKLCAMPGVAAGQAAALLGAGAPPADLWWSCLDYVENPNLESFRAFRSKLFEAPVVATAATFPAFICPERFPMVDKQVTRWALENGSSHRCSGVGGPDLKCVPDLAGVLLESHWPFVESWIAWCRFTAWKLGQCSGRRWRARDVEMAVFTAKKNGLPLAPLA